MKWIVPSVLVLVGLIHLPPLLGVLGPAKLEALYGVTIAEPNLAILMRHRAVLFGLLGGFFLAAAFVPSLQAGALLLSLLSTSSFVLLAWSSAGANAQLGRVALIDVVAVLLTLVGLAAWVLGRAPANGA
jgi:hypothetical protein